MSKLDDIFIHMRTHGVTKARKQEVKDLFDSLIVEQFGDTGGDVEEIRRKVSEL